MLDLDRLGCYREGNRLEAKQAVGALPKSIWETYSAFANSYGGLILLGVGERADMSLYAVGVRDPEKLAGDFWNTINNPKKVNINILLDKHVRVEMVDGKAIVAIEVPRAQREFKPVFLNEKPYAETYRRNGDGDYRCTPQMVDAMIRDKGDRAQDMLVMEKTSLDALDYETLRGFRTRMRHTRPGHVWDKLDDIEFLQKLGAISFGEDDKRHPTAAGLWMFGFEPEIVRAYPNYFLDYRERYDADARYTDRIQSTSGEWSGNLCDFFFKAYNKLIQNPKIKTPFKMADGLTRIDDTPIHKALREALANCVSNADFYGGRGLVVRNNIDEIVFENPGNFRIELDEARSGGVSSPRNPAIMKMFGLLDIGERLGSGIPSIYEAWANEGFDEPKYDDSLSIGRTILTLALTKTSETGERKKRAKQANEKNGRNRQAGQTGEAGDRGRRAKQAYPSADKGFSKGELRKRAIIAYVAANPPAKTADIAASVGVSDGRARVYLRGLVIDGVLVSEGKTHNSVYRLKQPG